jgi:hypothetical protein
VENYMMRNLMIYTLTRYCSGDKIEMNEMGGACSAYNGGESDIEVLVRTPEG